ncbi:MULTISPECIES: thioesterase family protein [unclassified Brevundimonas]|uniref:thioesterase family protein n=1 Tax=unclassified Brevundimonas TaxID=2622653 RepID=UPI0025C105E3|nr:MULTISPECIES: thioesterase family protein [unclassified Brevundimonas]
MTDPMPSPSEDLMADAMTMQAEGANRRLLVRPEFSNAPNSFPPEKGFPFGGLLAAVCAKTMKEGLEIDAPLQSLTVQYLAAARFGEEVLLEPRLMRQGRQITYATLTAAQGERLTHCASATFGIDGECETPLHDRNRVPDDVHTLSESEHMSGPFAPRFASQIEYRFERGPNIFGGNKDRARREGAWMRFRDGQPLDVYRLCYLMDALYPPASTAFERPVLMTTVDLRYDFITPPSAMTAPDGWAYVEFDMIDFDRDWTVDDVNVWGVDGTLLSVGRQRRRVLNRK